MKYFAAILLIISCFACKKEADKPAPGNNSTTGADTPAAPVTIMYTGSYLSAEVFEDPLRYYYLDTAFIDTMRVTFVDSAHIQCKIHTYTIYHSRISPGIASPAGGDSLEFSCSIGTSWTFLDTLKPPVRGGAIRMTPDRDSVYFLWLYHSGTGYYYHSSSFAGKKL